MQDNLPLRSLMLLYTQGLKLKVLIHAGLPWVHFIADSCASLTEEVLLFPGLRLARSKTQMTDILDW